MDEAGSSKQCIVCTAAINSTRFGMDACRACSSFFKRTKLAGKQYTCRQGNGKCSTGKDHKFVCRGCRFNKCIAVGMEYDGPMRVRKKPLPFLRRIKMELRALTERRREKELKIINQHGGHKRFPHPTEMLFDVHQETCMDIYRVFLVESYEFFNNAFPDFSKLASKERELIFKDYIGKLGMVENYQRAMRLWGGISKYQMYSVMTCFYLNWTPSEEEKLIDNIKEIESYTTTYIEDLNRLYVPIFKRCEFTEREYCALMALAMYEIDIECDLSEEAELILEKYRHEALDDLQLHYRNDLGLRDYSTRLGNLMTANHAIQECKSLFKVFFRFYSTMFDVFITENLLLSRIMRSVILLSLLIAVTFGAPLTTSQQQEIRDTYGPETDVARAEDIIREEAGKLGLTFQQYYDGCSTADSDEMLFSAREKADLDEEAAALRKAGPPRFSDKSEVMPAIKKHAPKMHAALEKRLTYLAKALKGLDEHSNKFFRTLGDAALESVVLISQASQRQLENPVELIRPFAKHLKKIFDNYDALPQSSKDAIEKRFCIRSSFRIMDTEGKLSQMLAIAKANAELA